MNNGKIIRNQERNIKPIFKPYVPQYKIWDREPTPAPSSHPFKNANQPIFVKSNVSKNTSQPQQKQTKPYAETHIQTNNIMPNVGAMAWNGEIEDDIGLDEQTQLIDNNDYYTAAALENINPEIEQQAPISNDVDLQEDEYLLMVNGEIISTGALNPIQREVKDLVFGDHALFQEQIPLENIMVLKRIKIKMGVFLDE